MENKLVSGAYGIEVQVTGNKVFFPEIQQLRNKRIKHIDVFNSALLPKTPSGKNIMSDIANNYITIRESNTSLELIQNLSMALLNQNGARLFINKIIDFQNSYFEYRGSESITNKSLYFVFWYDEPAAWSLLNGRGRTAIKNLQLTLNGTRTYFSENLDLKDRKIQNMYLMYPSYTPNGLEALSGAFVQNKFITLSRNNVEFFYRVPLRVFYQGSDYYPLRLQNIMFDFQSSYIESLTTTANDLKTVFMNVIIDDNK